MTAKTVKIASIQINKPRHLHQSLHIIRALVIQAGTERCDAGWAHVAAFAGKCFKHLRLISPPFYFHYLEDSEKAEI